MDEEDLRNYLINHLSIQIDSEDEQSIDDGRKVGVKVTVKLFLDGHTIDSSTCSV